MRDRQEILAMPVMGRDDRELAMSIQLERVRKEGWRPFSFIDELLLRIICHLMSLRFERDFLSSKLNDQALKTSSVIQTMTQILACTSQGSLIQLMRKHLPKFHGFEDLGLLFYDAPRSRFYTIIDPTLCDRDDQIIYYAADLGVCGEMVASPRVRVQDSKTAPAFRSEIDGIPTVARVRNFMFCPLFLHDRKPPQLLAIMQFANKEGGYAVTENDIQLFKQMSGVYELLVERTMEKQTVMNAIVKMKDRTNAITGLLPKEDAAGRQDDAELNLAHVAGSLLRVGGIIDDFAVAKHRRIKRARDEMAATFSE